MKLNRQQKEQLPIGTKVFVRIGDFSTRYRQGVVRLTVAGQPEYGKSVFTKTPSGTEYVPSHAIWYLTEQDVAAACLLAAEVEKADLEVRMEELQKIAGKVVAHPINAT
jgi:hypothetical protein